MRYLIFNKKDHVFFVAKNDYDQYDLFTRNPTEVPPVDTICKLKRGDYCQLVVLDVDSKEWLPMFPNIKVLGSKHQRSHDLWWCIKVFFMFGQLVQLANSFDDDHKAEKDYTLKVIGLLKPIVLEEEL